MKIKICPSNSRRQLCRLCGSIGYYQKTILDNAAGSSTEFSEKIYRCVGIRVERNDRMTRKICETCFEKVNEFDRFRASCIATRTLTNANAVADPCDADADATNDTESVCSEKWSVTGGDTSSVASKNDGVDANERKSDELTALGRNLLLSSQVRPDPSTSDVIDVEPTNAAGAMINLFLERFVEYAQMLYANNASNTSGLDNHLADNTTNAQPSEQQIDALDDSSVIYISSTEDEVASEVEIAVSHTKKEGNGSASTKTEKRSRRRATKGLKSSLVKCRLGICTELFESNDALMHHIENYHAEGNNNVFSCHLCKKPFPGKRTLRTHFHYMHSRQMRFPCTIANCSKFFPTKRIMQEHINGMHTKEVAFNCTKCSFKSYYKCNLMKHSTLSHHHDD